MMSGLFLIVSLYTSLTGSLNQTNQLKTHRFALVIAFISSLETSNTSVGKLSPVTTFSIELVSLSILKSSPFSFFFT